MSFFLVKLHITEARSLARSRLCCPTRHHLTGPVRVPLRPSPSNLSISGFAAGLFHPDDERPCGVQVLRFVSIIACRRPYSGFPIGAYSHCFPIGIGLRPKRRGSACIRVSVTEVTARFIPVHPTLPAIRVGGYLSRSCSVHFLITACEFGRRHRLGLTGGKRTYHQQFRTAVSGQVPPRCRHLDAPSTYSAKWDLAEPDSFHSGRNKFQTSYTSEVTGLADQRELTLAHQEL